MVVHCACTDDLNDLDIAITCLPQKVAILPSIEIKSLDEYTKGILLRTAQLISYGNVLSKLEIKVLLKKTSVVIISIINI